MTYLQVSAAEAARPSFISPTRPKHLDPARTVLVFPLPIQHLVTRKCLERRPCRLSALRGRFEREDFFLLRRD